MEYSDLYSMMEYLQYGTNLHIGVLFFGGYYNEMLKVPHKQMIHASPLCDEFKSYPNGYKRCFRCRNMAIKKAMQTKAPFGGLCINGIYEYTRPVIINDEVASIIYIGNISDGKNGYEKIRHNIGEKQSLLKTMEENFGIEKCEAVGKLLESYIRVLLEKYRSHSKNNTVVENIKNYIDSNLEFDIDINRIAQIFHYNKWYLGRMFKKETNQSFSDYVNSRRLETACYLLKNSEDTVLNISYKVGFNNVTYFNRLFKQAFGITPTDFRHKV